MNRPVLVVENGVIKEAREGESKPKLWPGNGYVGRTCDGSYDPDGVPYQTWPTRAKAERTWLDVGADTEFARDAVSYAWARNEGQGKAIVDRRFLDHDLGRFLLNADGSPVNRGDRVGRSPVSR